MDTRNAELVTRKHMQRVSHLLGDAAIELVKRAQQHDLSKLTDVELEPLQTMQDLIDKEGQAPFGSDEYKRRTALLKPMLEHHYLKNRHHPEHHQFEFGGDCMHGVNGMDLFDVLEMFLDWKAASERGEESQMHIASACERFHIDDQLKMIMQNTANRFGWKHG